MGASFHAYLMVGVAWSDVVEVKKATVRTKRFHEITGKQYEKLDDVETTYVCGLVVGDPHEFFASKGLYELHKVGEMGIVERDGERFIGLLLENQDVEYGGSVGAYSPKELAARFNTAKTRLAEILGQEVPLKLFDISRACA
jgi:hypothetical protein